MELRKIGVLSMGRISAWIYGIMGLIFGLLFSLITLLGMVVGGGYNDRSGILGLFFGLGAFVIFPIFYAILGFLCGLLTAFIYNLVARYSGGLELEFVQPASDGGQAPVQPAQ